MIPLPVADRQQLTGGNPDERMRREGETGQLVDDILGRNAEHFAEPESRVDFLQSLDSSQFFAIAQYANAKLRGEKPLQVRQRKEEGGYLPALHTPMAEDKPRAFARGFEAVQEYLHESDDTAPEKVAKVGMAVEALIIWVHPFNDANGRTSRFLGKLIEDGAQDREALVTETAHGAARGNMYNLRQKSKASEQAVLNNPDIFLDDDEIAAIEAGIEDLPDSVEAIYQGVHRLLTNDKARDHAIRGPYNSRRIGAAAARHAVAAANNQ